MDRTVLIDMAPVRVTKPYPFCISNLSFSLTLEAVQLSKPHNISLHREVEAGLVHHDSNFWF